MSSAKRVSTDQRVRHPFGFQSGHRSGESLPHLDFANRYAEEYFGIAAEAIAGDRWIELVHPEDRARVRVAWAASLATGQHYRHAPHHRHG